MKHWLILIWLAATSTVPAANRPAEADPLALAALMLSDHHPERAIQILTRPETRNRLEAGKLDPGRYHLLLGLAWKAQQQWHKAGGALQQAMAHGVDTPRIHLYRAQVAWAMEDHAGVLEAVDRTGPLLESIPALHLMKARSLWALEQNEAAWRALNSGLRRFPDNPMLLRQQVDFLLQLKLYRQAAQHGLAWIESGLGNHEDWLAIGNALRASRQRELALRLLEPLHLRHPDDVRISRLLARTWLDQGHPLAAADLLYRTWMHQGSQDQALLAETTELYRRAGRLHTALALSSRLKDETVKLRQRLALYLQLEQYDKLLNSEKTLQRLGLLQDENIRYTLAYAAFRRGDFQRMESHLQAITDADLFRKAAALRQAAQRCSDQPWQCIG